MSCDFYETGVSYSDAEKLAKYWGVDMSDAKIRVADKIMWEAHMTS